MFKAAESLKARASGSLNFKLWKGDIDDPITDDRQIGVLKISGSDFDHGVIPAGAHLECDYEILDSGNIIRYLRSVHGRDISFGQEFLFAPGRSARLHLRFCSGR